MLRDFGSEIASAVAFIHLCMILIYSLADNVSLQRLGEETAAIKSSQFLEDIRQGKLLRMNRRPIMMASA